MAEKIRLNKFIASCGFCSRRKADEYILEGRVKVNGTIVKEIGTSITLKDKILIDNKPIATPKLTYIRYYKPAGYITTMDDEKGRKTIYDLLPEEVKHLKPVGRLDKDSTGLLIMTKKGAINSSLSFEEAKTHICSYVTPFMPFKVYVTTKRLENSLLKDGRLLLDYILNIDDTAPQHFIVDVEIKEAPEDVLRDFLRQ